MSLEQVQKIPQELSPYQLFFQQLAGQNNQTMNSEGNAEERDQGWGDGPQPDQIENNDPNLFARNMAASRMKNATQSNSQAHLIKLIQE